MHPDPVLHGIAQGVPVVGPRTVHIDVTNACNARCITCWDHSPLLANSRSAAWKAQRLPWERFAALVDELERMGSVRRVVIVSGMGEPLIHPRIYDMMARVKLAGWKLTLLTNLVAADIDQLIATGVDEVLIGTHGATPETYMAFHPGWNETHFATMCRFMRALVRAGIRTKHVQVINRDTAPEVVDMVGFGHRFGAARVNFKLASLAGGTQGCAMTSEQQEWLAREGIEQARNAAAELGVATNLDLFQTQVEAWGRQKLTTVPIAEVGCFMGYVYTRIAVDGTVLFCCNTEVEVGSLYESRFVDLWTGPRWQQLRDALRTGETFPGCERCGKFEQNVVWSGRVRKAFGDAVWRSATGAAK